MSFLFCLFNLAWPQVLGLVPWDPWSGFGCNLGKLPSLYHPKLRCTLHCYNIGVCIFAKQPSKSFGSLLIDYNDFYVSLHMMENILQIDGFS